VRGAGPAPPAHAVACGDGGLVAAGAGVWSTADGADWRRERVGLGPPYSAVAWAGGRAWLASEAGLEVVEAGDAPAAEDASAVAAQGAWRWPARAERRPPVWAALLPRVALALDGWSESRGVAGWRLWVLLTVSLGRRGPQAGSP
jgi:hypothetical protein